MSINHDFGSSHFQGPAVERMTLRDYFAGQAPDLPEWFNRLSGEYSREMVWSETETLIEHLTRWRYAYADAMLAARAKGQP